MVAAVRAGGGGHPAVAGLLDALHEAAGHTLGAPRKNRSWSPTATTTPCSPPPPTTPRRSPQFYRLHVRGVIAYFRRRVGNAELAADLTAETFASALAGRRRFAPTAARRRRGSTASRGASS